MQQGMLLLNKPSMNEPTTRVRNQQADHGAQQQRTQYCAVLIACYFNEEEADALRQTVVAAFVFAPTVFALLKWE